jgi:O-antigen/teichoic acid export membrane protein
MTLNDYKKANVFHVLTSNLLLKVVGFLYLILLARIFNNEEMGIVAYIDSILRFFIPFFSAGLFYGIILFGSRDNILTNSITKQALILSLYINIFISLLVVIFTFNYKFAFDEIELIFLIILFSGFIRSYKEIFFSVLRANKNNKQYSLYLFINSILLFLFVGTMSYLFGLYGYAIGMVMTPFSILLIMFKYSDININDIINAKKSNITNKELFNKSIVTSITNLFSSILYSIDTFLVSTLLMSSYLTSVYYIGTIIPFNLSFIALSLMVALFPYLSQKYDDKKFMYESYYKSLKYLFLLSFFIAIILYQISDYLIPFLFGDKYLESIEIFNILLIGFVFASSFRIISGNYLASMGLVKYNLYIALFSGTLNIILDYVLISNYGIIGAAYATSIIMIVSGLVGHVVLLKVLKRS